MKKHTAGWMVVTLALGVGVLVGTAQGGTIYWDGTSGSWNTAANWSTDPGAATPDPAVVPGAPDTAIFNISSVDGNQSINLNANPTVKGLTFENTGTTTLLSGGSARTLTLGTDGLTIASGAGAVTLGDGSANNNVIISLTSGAQAWNNSTATALTLNNTTAPITRNNGATLNFVTGGYNLGTTIQPLVNDILGNWAFHGTGANMKYATRDGSGVVSGYTAATSTSFTNPVSATANYTTAEATSVGINVSRTANTLHYTGTNTTYDYNNAGPVSHLYTVNGILATGASGTLTWQRAGGVNNTSTMRIGNANELVIAGQQDVTFNQLGISGETASTGALTYSGTGTLRLTSSTAQSASTYGGGTTINSGTVILTGGTASLGAITGSLTMNGGVLDMPTVNLIVGSLTGVGGTINIIALRFFTVNQTTDGTYAGAIAGEGSFILGASSTHKLTLTGTSTYAGNTSIMGGTLQLGQGDTSGALSPSSAISVATNAVFVVNQTDTVTQGTDFSSAAITGQGGFTQAGSGTTVLNAANSYSGPTTVQGGGTLNLTGNRTAAAGSITVQGGSTLGISNGSFSLGTTAFSVGVGAAGTGTVNHTAGSISTGGGPQVLLGIGTSRTGIYNLSGGTLTTFVAGHRGVMLGVNTGGIGTFNLSGTGTLQMTTGGNSILQIGRSDDLAHNTTALFNQTGGTAAIGILAMGGGVSTNVNSTLTLSGGTFTASTFTLLAAGTNNTAIINIGGTAVVTLPNLPTARGPGATATINFDGGTLKNSATGTFITGLNNAFIKAGGATFDTSLNSTTISQALLTHGSSTGGGLTKSGVNTLTLSGVNTYTGDTTVNAGTLQLTTGGSIANSASIMLASGARFDVSTLTTPLTLAAGQTLKGGATGGNTTATITLAAGKGLALSNAGVAFTAFGAGTTPPLTVAGTGGSLDMNNVPVSITTLTLSEREYTLIAKSGSATVSGSVSSSILTVNGETNPEGYGLLIVDGELVLTVKQGTVFRFF